VNRTTNMLLPVLCLAFFAVAGCHSENNDDRRRVGKNAFIDISRGEESVCGNLQINFIETETVSEDSAKNPVYASIFARNSRYLGVEDNDLRGYLDGSFKEGWNQVSQSHLRLGRRGRNPAFGELELFRNLQRWADLPLPSAVEILDANIRLTLESGPPFDVDIAVYSVLKDWNPGNGGINEDNNSPPALGEAWWRDAKYGEVPWSKAGVGYASDTDPGADTPAQPLAVTRYLQGQSKQLVFASDNLTRYVGSNIKAGQPVLLLYKLLDVYEDSPGSVLEIWSSNYGVEGSTRRPRLSVRWRSTNVVSGNTYALALEPGRAIKIPSITVGGRRTIVSAYTPDADIVDHGKILKCSQEPYVEYRTSGTDENWVSVGDQAEINAETIDLRVSAVTRPVPLGDAFVSEIRDTWVVSGAPEDNMIYWEFESPDGRRIHVTSDYAGDYTWRVSLNTDAIGRWQYKWWHSLSGSRLESEMQHFDVIAWKPRTVTNGLISLKEAILASGAVPKSYEILPFELSFMRLQRAAMVLRPDEIADNNLHFHLRSIRELLSGDLVPAEFQPEPIRTRKSASPPQ